MQNPGSARPRYSVDAVDHTLLLLTMLWRDDAVRVSDAATVLDVARSTAHRLLRMLVYRGFAVQRDDRSYAPGPAMARPVSRTDRALLRSRLRPAMEHVHHELDETVHLVIRDGAQVLFVESIEARQPLRVGARTGVRLPAEVTSGGKILLAQLAPPAVRALYAGRCDIDAERMERMLARTRRQRFGLNVDESEPGITAVGVCVPDAHGEPFAALTVSAPTLRVRRSRATALADVLHAAVADNTALWSVPGDDRRASPGSPATSGA